MDVIRFLELKLSLFDLLPELHTDLLTILRQSTKNEQCLFLHQIPISLFHALGGEDESLIEPFVAAWTCLHSVLLRLDHLQDHDPEDEPLPTSANMSASYHLLFAAFVVANSALDEIDTLNIPPTRLLLLHRLWNESMIISASGQYQDILRLDTLKKDRYSLDQYQKTIETKSGSLFALAFAGTALITTDDVNIITACRYIGNIYGTILQIYDDIIDNGIQIYTEQNDIHIALSNKLSINKGHEKSDYTFFLLVFSNYIRQVEYLLDQIEHPQLCSYLRSLFDPSNQFNSSAEVT